MVQQFRAEFLKTRVQCWKVKSEMNYVARNNKFLKIFTIPERDSRNPKSAESMDSVNLTLNRERK